MKKRYSTYKSSGVEWIGEIPKHWEVKPLKYVVSCNTNSLPENTDPDYELDYVEISDVDSQGNIVNQTKYTFKESPSRCRRVLRKGDVFISTVRTYLKSIGYVKNDVSDLICSTGFCVLTPKKIKSEFLFNMVLNDWFIGQVISKSEGVSYPSITSTELVKIKILQPPLSEQEQIVKYLDEKTSQIDGLISITEKKIELLKQKRTSLINEVVTKGLNPNVEMKDSGVEWIGEIPKHWEVRRIGFVSELLTGYPWKSDLFDFNEGLKIVRGENVSEGFLRWGERTRFWKLPVDKNRNYFLSENDIVVSMDGSKVGKNYVRITQGDLPLLLHQRMCRIRIKSECNSVFLSYFIGSEMFRYHIDISKTDPMIPHITEKDIYNFKFSLPPLSEQEQIVKYIDNHTTEIDKLVSIEQRRIETLKEYRQGLISEVVTGKVRVCEEVSELQVK